MSAERVMLLTSSFPTSVNAGNLAYLKFIIDLLEEEADAVLVVVIGDRFADHEYAVKDPSTDKVRYVTTFSKKLGSYHVLWGLRFWLKNVPRSVWLRLPSALRQLVARVYSSVNAPAPNAPENLPSTDGKSLDMKTLKLLTELVSSFKPTHVLADRADHFDYLKPICGDNIATGIICHDLVSNRHRDAAAVGLVSDMDYITELGEMMKLAAVDTVIAIQRDEAEQIARLVPGHVAHIPYLPITSHAGQELIDSEPVDKLLFVASGGLPNITGITWFLEAIWPLILVPNPRATLDVVGAVGNFVSHDVKGVRFHGKVREVQPFYRKASVVIVPLRIGSGLKIKLVEALAAGSACVTTSIGAQGLEAGTGDAFLLADDPTTFANAVLTLLGDPHSRQQLRSKSKQFLEHTFDRARAIVALREALNAPIRPRLKTDAASATATVR